MFLTVVGAPAMSMTSHTIKADDAQKKKRRRIALGVVGAAATLAAGAVAYKNRGNISTTFNQMRGKSTTATATAKSAQTKDTQNKTTSPERRGAIKQVKTDNKPMETKPATATNPVAAPIASKAQAPTKTEAQGQAPAAPAPANASQSEAPQTRPLLSNSQSTKGAIYNEKGVGVSNKAPKEAQPRAPKDSTNKAQAPAAQGQAPAAPAPAPAPAPASAPQSNAPQTRPKTFEEMKRDGDLVYSEKGVVGNKNAPQAPKFDPEKMQKKPNIAKQDSTKTTQAPAPAAPAPAPAQEPAAPAPAKSLAEQLQEAKTKLKPVPQQDPAAGNAAAAEKKRAAELRKETPEMKNLRQNIEARQKQAAEAEAAKALRKAEKEKAKAAAAEAAAAAAK